MIAAIRNNGGNEGNRWDPASSEHHLLMNMLQPSAVIILACVLQGLKIV